MSSLDRVFLVQHLHVQPNGEECVKLIGVYGSRASADNAVARVAAQPGFKDWPEVLEEYAVDASGFFISEYAIDKDHWTEGFVTDNNCDLPAWLLTNERTDDFQTDD